MYTSAPGANGIEAVVLQIIRHDATCRREICIDWLGLRRVSRIFAASPAGAGDTRQTLANHTA